MQRIFGFDIGTTSIGWAVIDHDRPSSSGRIVSMGVRIFPEARDEKGTPLNQERRRKRLVRRQLRRRKRRRRALNELLASVGLLPQFSKDKHSAWAEVMSLPPLELRSRGLSEPLEPHELGRALYHLSQLRHFKSRDIEDSGEPEAASADEKAAKSARDITIQALQASSRTLGQMLAELAPAAGDIPARRTRAVHALRKHVEDEFDRLLAAQDSHHAMLRDPAFRAAIRETIFAQRPIFWRRNTLGQCRFIPGAPLCPKGSWLSQQRRMLEKVNNLAVVGGNMRPLDAEERAAILVRLEAQASMTWNGVRTALRPLYKRRGLSGEEKALRFNLELGGEAKLIGNAVEAKLAAIFGEAWGGHPRKQEIRDSIHEHLWEADYCELGTQRVAIRPEAERNRLRAEVAEHFARCFAASPEQARALSELSLPPGWEPFSTQALKVFLPRLEEGIHFGALTGGPEWAHWREIHFPDRDRPAAETLERLPSPANRDEQKRLAIIRNPTVVRSQNELRKVVNNLVGAYGRPDLIRIELAREIGLSKRERNEVQRGIQTRERRRREAVDDLRSNRIEQPSSADIEKWILWKETKERCPYTGSHIGFDALFRNGEYQIEHIWPRSRSLDDSLRNKTLCHRDINIAKGSRTPYEFYHGRPDDWSAVTNRLRGMIAGKGTPGMPFGKVKRFLSDVLPDDFADRQLVDTGYAARQAIAFLKRLWPDIGPEAPVAVQAVAGRVTVQLRRFWELNNILGRDGEKTRADHRHHAIDALVVACTDPGITGRLSRYWQQKENMASDRPRLLPPWPDIRLDADRAVSTIVVSHRVRKKVSGPLHKETTYGDTGQDVKSGRITYRAIVERTPVIELTAADIEADDPATSKHVVRDPAVRRLLREHVRNSGGDIKRALADPPHLGRGLMPVRKVRLLRKRQLRGLVAAHNGLSDPEAKHHVAIFRHKDGSHSGDVVSLFDVAGRIAKGWPIVDREGQGGAIFVMSLAKGDMIAIDDARSAYWVVREIKANLQITLAPHTEARPTKSALTFQPTVPGLMALNPRKVSIDPIGRVRTAND